MPGAGPEGLTLGRDARTLYLSLSQEDRVAVIDVDAMEVVRHIPTGSGPDGVVFSHLILKQ